MAEERLRLTEYEQQEVRRYIDANKPLPEKYRFLLFEDKREVELVWNGKTNQVCNLVLPFQTIEHVDEPRKEQPDDQLSLFDTRGRQMSGWANKLIWGDNKLILSSLKNGPLRQEIEAQGGLKLIYIDPPFDVGADFSMDIEIGDGGETLTKKPNILEEIAYRDTWGKGADSFISMIYERLILMRDLLAEDGSIYVHCDWRVNAYLRLCMDEIFGKGSARNEIIWQRTSAHNDPGRYGIIDDHIIFYTKSADKWTWTDPKTSYEEWYVERYYRYVDEKTGKRFLSRDITAPAHGRATGIYEWKGKFPPKGRMWAYTEENMKALEHQGKLFYTNQGIPRLKQFLDEMNGAPVQTIWDDLLPIVSWSDQGAGYPTQKPEGVVERIISASSNPGDLVADFFVGSGTTAAVAEKLGRKWIATDLGKFAIHTTRKRLIGVQRELKKQDKPYRAFEILNLGKYERQMFVVAEGPQDGSGERAQQVAEMQAAKDGEFLELILRAYQAQATTGFRTFQAMKAGRLVAVGPVNMPVTRLFIEELVLECREKKITRVDVLAFEFEMGLFPQALDEAKSKGIDIQPKHIPAEVFDKRAVERGQVAFYDVAYVEATPHYQDPHKLAIELTDFSVFYSQDANEQVIRDMKDKSSKVIVDHGQVVKVTKDQHGTVSREVLTTKWTDWVDYWSIDLDYENKKEMIRRKLVPEAQEAFEGMEAAQGTLEAYEEVWTGDYVFENEWQSFRTKQNRSLELKTPYFDLSAKPGRRKVAVKVVDIFGNDTMRLIEVNV